MSETQATMFPEKGGRKSRTAKPLPPLKAGTDRYVGRRGLMVWVNTAAIEHKLPLWVPQRKLKLYGKRIHRETRDMIDPRAASGVNKRLFILDSQCPEMVEFCKHLKSSKTAVGAARARGFIPVRDAAGILDKGKNVVTGWVHNGCPYLPNHRQPAHEWVETLKGANPQVLFVARADVREILTAVEGKRSAKPSRKPVYIEREGVRFIHSSEAVKRCGCTFTSLANWATGKTPTPGEGGLRRIQDRRDDWYYHEGDVDQAARSPKGAGQHRLHEPKIDPATGERLLPTRMVMELCQCSEGLLNHWRAGRVPTPGGLPLSPKKLQDQGHRLNYWHEDEVVAIANYVAETKAIRRARPELAQQAIDAAHRMVQAVMHKLGLIDEGVSGVRVAVEHHIGLTKGVEKKIDRIPKEERGGPDRGGGRKKKYDDGDAKWLEQWEEAKANGANRAEWITHTWKIPLKQGEKRLNAARDRRRRSAST